VLLRKMSRRCLRSGAKGPKGTLSRSTLVVVALTAVLVLTACTASWEVSDHPGRSTTTPLPQRPTTTRPTTTTTRPTTTTTRQTTTTSKPSTTTTTTAPRNIATVAPDGGNGPGQPFDQPGRHLPNDHSFFPLGVWLQHVDDCAAFKALGINTYMGVTRNSNLTQLQASSCGLRVIPQVDEWCPTGPASCPTSPAIAGWSISDEADMIHGPGAGYTSMAGMEARAPNGDMRWANYGLGVLDWETDQEASGFVNGPYQDAVSVDKYWFTHPAIAAADRKGARYGDNVSRVRHLDSLAGGTAPADRQPQWAYVEVGHPFTESYTPTITPAQMRSAVWHSIIAGARGVVYFNHSFGGSCQTQSVLTSTCPPAVTMRSAVQTLNTQVTELAPVLNAATANQYVTTSSNIRTVTKIGGDDAAFGQGMYTIAGATWAGSGAQQATIAINPVAGPTSGTASVLFEDRSVPIVAGKIVDTFADGNAIHIYKW
jgi:hypothetical protein